MRPPALPQSALAAPLNDILGTEGAVRILRELSKSEEYVGAGPLAARCQLQPAAVRRSLATLLDAGVVDVAGEVRMLRYSLRRSHPLAHALQALFGAELQRVEDVLTGITHTVWRLSPPPIAVWIEGPVASGTDQPGDPVALRLVAPAADLNALQNALREALEPIETSLDVSIEIRGATPQDLSTKRDDVEWTDGLRTARSLFGLPPTAYLAPPVTARVREDGPTYAVSRIRSHADLDARSLHLARAVAERLRHEPTLVARARAFVEKRLRVASAGEQHELREWQQLLRSASPARLRRFLVDTGERATRLRQTSPFVGVLSADERQAILDAMDATSDSSGVIR